MVQFVSFLNFEDLIFKIESLGGNCNNQDPLGVVGAIQILLMFC